MSFEVVAKYRGGNSFLMLRRFAERSLAEAHLPKVNPKFWSDVHIRDSAKDVPPEPTEPPPLPWDILWQGGWSYLIDANGKKIATIYGREKQREFVAGMLLEKFGAEK